MTPPLPSLYALSPAELAASLGGSRRARDVWHVLREGKAPLTSGVLPSGAQARLLAACQVTLPKVLERHIAPVTQYP